MPITPYSGMVDAAIRFKNLPQLWLAIGRTTPWVDETQPPNENDFQNHPEFLSYVQPDELIGLKRIEVAQLCVPDTNGEVRYRNQRYKLIDDIEAMDRQARWVYIRASLDYVEKNTAGVGIIGFVTYRQTAIMSDIKPLTPYKDETVLAPDQVEVYPADYPIARLRGKVKGRMVFLANHTPRERDGAQRDITEIVREFRG